VARVRQTAAILWPSLATWTCLVRPSRQSRPRSGLPVPGSGRCTARPGLSRTRESWMDHDRPATRLLETGEAKAYVEPRRPFRATSTGRYARRDRRELGPLRTIRAYATRWTGWAGASTDRRPTSRVFPARIEVLPNDIAQLLLDRPATPGAASEGRENTSHTSHRTSKTSWLTPLRPCTAIRKP
jgi:hypothetical protein